LSTESIYYNSTPNGHQYIKHGNVITQEIDNKVSFHKLVFAKNMLTTGNHYVQSKKSLNIGSH